MHVRPLAVGLILFGLLVLGGTIDGARRKLVEQPDWMAQNWPRFLKGMIGWLAAGALALLGGIVGVFL
jgi:hypothetical protein